MERYEPKITITIRTILRIKEGPPSLLAHQWLMMLFKSMLQL
jgi:hypothetical protein